MDSTPPAPDTVAVTVVHSPACHFCDDARAVAGRPRDRVPAHRRVRRLHRTTRRRADPRAPRRHVPAGAGGRRVLQRRPFAAQEAARPAHRTIRGGGVIGSSLLTTGSVLAAFFAGGVALFAPCCIVFLAPSYLAVAVKNRRWRLLPLTFVFAAGLALVLVPITLGMSLIAATIANYHTLLYYLGGALMLLLAAYSLSGRMWSLPSFLRAPDTARGDSASFFALGVFSGIASSLLRTGARRGHDPVRAVRLRDRRHHPRPGLRARDDVPAVHDGAAVGPPPARGTPLDARQDGPGRIAGRHAGHQHHQHRRGGRVRGDGRVRHLPRQHRHHDQRSRFPGRHRRIAHRRVRPYRGMDPTRPRSDPGVGRPGGRRRVRLRHPARPPAHPAR